ncbi:alpha/beta hydrolase [Nannocystis punicea]|uniref:Alpha/beta hydrolase n=1 Tax=Nannocystis punicea TaxID=2995304 RepID=A0ABY7H6L5_9BACT|nr:alpha/beta hydrolase [Nannocystis poenicansa]WAS94629.1 alpha/beta hydrolase [Nannocystis poenicansa]
MLLHVEPVAAEVAAETLAFNEGLEAMLAKIPSAHTVPPALVRAGRRAGKGTFPAPVYLPNMRDLEIPARGGPVRLRVARPPSAARGVYLHLHGGGWMLGAADLQDPALTALAAATGLVVVSVDYRLAPEHPFPAGPDDCEDAARWLVEHGARVLDAPPVFTIGGESAGAHLAVLTLLRLRDRGDLARVFRAANLVYGAYDLSLTPSQRAWGERNLVLSRPLIEYFGAAFAPGRSLEQRRVPELSPLYADLRGLVPALFTVGTLDPLLDDTLFMATRWRMAGNPGELRVWPDAVHGFNSFPIALGRLADAATYEYLARMLPAT